MYLTLLVHMLFIEGLILRVPSTGLLRVGFQRGIIVALRRIDITQETAFARANVGKPTRWRPVERTRKIIPTFSVTCRTLY